jgi:MHS family proline/betaine transporter-like MFS transporter
MAKAGCTAESRSRRAVVTTGIGTLIEGYDVLLYAYLAGILAEQFFPAADPTAALLNTFAIFAVGLVARPVGGLVFGHIGDRFGRRRALVASILLMAVATLAIGLLPSYHTIGKAAPALLLACRLLQGLSIGGEYVGANIMVLEHAGRGHSGRAVSTNQVATYLGAAAAATASLLLATSLTDVQLGAWGWRLPFLAAVPLGVVTLYLRIRIPESPVSAAPRDVEPSLPVVVAVRTAKRGMLVFAGWLTMVTLGGFLLFGYMPTYLHRVVRLSAGAAFGASLGGLAALAAGAIVGGYLADRYRLRSVAIVCAAGVAVTAWPSFLLIQHGTVASAVMGQVVWAGCIGAAATVSALLSLTEFPAPIRYTATGLSYNVTVALLGGTAPYVCTWLVLRTHTPLAPAGYLVVMALVALATAVVGLRSRSQVPAGLPFATERRAASRA